MTDQATTASILEHAAWVVANGPNVLNRAFIKQLSDRLEAVHRALETARTALEEVEATRLTPSGYCVWCRKLLPYHAPDCKRQQALTEIAGVLDGEKA